MLPMQSAWLQVLCGGVTIRCRATKRECGGEGTVKVGKQSFKTENFRTRKVPVFEKDLINESCSEGRVSIHRAREITLILL